jgi:phosphoglycolate phosphatase-like HAD superfamily hydrolase
VIDARLGEAVIVDFDGTLVHLAVPWGRLRRELAVAHINDLWRDADRSRWDVVTRAEVDAARTAAPLQPVMSALSGVESVAVLTSNHERAVDVALEGWPELRARVRVVVGRGLLGGPKTDFDVFTAGYERCVAALAPESSRRVAYVGDMEYELDFARRLGAVAFSVTEFQQVPK